MKKKNKGSDRVNKTRTRTGGTQLFVPCLVEDSMPQVAAAVVRVLERLGTAVRHRPGHGCCGQLLYKSGRTAAVKAPAKRIIEHFEDAEQVVAPTGSCVRMLQAYPELFADDAAWQSRARLLAGKTFEFSQFLVDRLGVTDCGAAFAGRVVYHDSCQVGRGLGLKNQPRALLRNVAGLELLEPAHPQECCGFGGGFSMDFPEVSAAILRKKANELLATGAEYMVCAEPSCLMHIRAYMEKHGHSIRCLHLAEILAQTKERP